MARGVFVQPGISDFFRDRALPAARIVTPNHFELDRLAGRDTADMAQVLAAIAALHARGPRAILVTSVAASETPAGHVDVVASDGSAQYLVRTPKLATAGNGAGDLIAALFLYHYLVSGSVAEALARATSSVFGLLRRMLAAGAPLADLPWAGAAITLGALALAAWSSRLGDRGAALQPA